MRRGSAGPWPRSQTTWKPTIFRTRWSVSPNVSLTIQDEIVECHQTAQHHSTHPAFIVDLDDGTRGFLAHQTPIPSLDLGFTASFAASIDRKYVGRRAFSSGNVISSFTESVLHQITGSAAFSTFGWWPGAWFHPCPPHLILRDVWSLDEDDRLTDVKTWRGQSQA